MSDGLSWAAEQLRQEKEEKMETKLIYKKMVAIAKDVGPVTKDGTNTMQGYKFRGVDQFVNALHPVLVKHGVLMVPSATSVASEIKDVTRSNGKAGVDKHVNLQMTYTFYAEDGSSVVVGPIPAEGLDSGDKATNKALSAALKYALIQTFTVPTEDMAEADLETPEIGTKINLASAGAASAKQSAALVATTALPLGSVQLSEKSAVTTPAPNVSSAPATPPASASSAVSSPAAPRRSTSFRKPKPEAAAAPVANSAAKPAVKPASPAVDDWG